MDIFMRNIPFAMNTNQVVDAISQIVHGSSFTTFNTELPLNFKVFLHQQRRSSRGTTGSHKGTGILTLPSEAVGQQFLLICGGKRPQIVVKLGSRNASFEQSTKPPRKEVVDTISRTPFVDPRVVEKREAILEEFEASSINIALLQFCWECRDGVLSAEWERYFSETPCTLKFEGERREIRISFRRPIMDERGYVSDYSNQIVSMQYSQISSICTSEISAESAIVFILGSPPTYEETVTKLQASLFPYSDRQPPRMRRTHLVGDADHERVAPYACLALRLLCNSRSDLDLFLHLARVAHLRGMQEFYYPVEHRSLFSLQNLLEIENWLGRLSQSAWPVAYQIDALLRNLLVDGSELLNLGDPIINCLSRQGIRYTAGVIKLFSAELHNIWSSEEFLMDIVDSFIEFERLYSEKTVRPRRQDNNFFECFHVVVTPSKFYLEGPHPERSNRIIRSYRQKEDLFIRVSFTDENHFQYRFDREIDGPQFVRERVGGILHHGLTIGGKRFAFLAYSQSALKEHSVWFITPFKIRLDGKDTIVDEISIIRNIGIFTNLGFDPRLMYCPARYGARISQAFTATDSSVKVEAEEILYIKDIKRNNSCFTDGVGTLSNELAESIWNALSSRYTRRQIRNRASPKAFQVRFMGSKGMLSVDYTLGGRAICIRPSMTKFDNPNSLEIEIAQSFDKPGRMCLNRPLIALLEGLGVKPETFLDLQRKAVRDLKESTTSMDKMSRLLESYGLGMSFHIQSVLLGLHKLGIKLEDPVYNKMIDIAMNHILRELKHHARIPVPGWSLVGVADEHNYLEEGEIFACVHPIDGARRYLEGPVMISRSPVIHPGDVQMVNAIGPPPVNSPFEKEPLQNTVVFSTKGDRSLPSCLGGGDLDGDLYNVTEYVPLHPTNTYESAAYDPAPRMELDRQSTMSDVADFVVDYINNDILGVIATNWLIFADLSTIKIFDPKCLLLAQLHSDAVDYPKSGRPVPLSKVPRLSRDQARPDWIAPEITVGSTSLYYTSNRALGQLYRDIDLPEINMSERQSFRLRNGRRGDDLSDAMRGLSIQAGQKSFVYLTIHDRVSEFIYPRTDSRSSRAMLELFNDFSSKLLIVCLTYTLSHARAGQLSEEEVLLGTIVAKSSQPKKRKDQMSKLRDETKFLVENTKADMLGEDDSASVTSGSSASTPLDRLKRSWQAWETANNRIQKDEFGAYSFWWISLDAIFDSIKAIENDERRSNLGR